MFPRPDAIICDVQLAWAPQERAFPIRRSGDEAGIFYPIEKRLKRDLTFQPGQRSSETAMNAAAKSEMLIILSL